MLVSASGKHRQLQAFALARVIGVVLLCACRPASVARPMLTPVPETAEGIATTTAPATASRPSVSTSTPATQASVDFQRQILCVGNTGGDGVYIRSPVQPERKIKAWPDGTAMTMVGADQTVGARTWANVRDPAGNQGWVPAEYLLKTPQQKPTTIAQRSVATVPGAGRGAQTEVAIRYLNAIVPLANKIDDVFEYVAYRRGRSAIVNVNAVASRDLDSTVASLRQVSVPGDAQSLHAALISRTDHLARYYGIWSNLIPGSRLIGQQMVRRSMQEASDH